MTLSFDFILTDNSVLMKKATHEKILKALELIGIQAEGDIKPAMN